MLAPIFVLTWMRPVLMTITDRAKRTPSRRALTMAGVATLAFSLIVCIGPALAAAGGDDSNNGNGSASGAGNAGTVKVHDATTGLEAVGNDPWVCAFWVGFYSDGAEVGTWELRSWAPTGDGSVAASGTYDTSAEGVDATSTLTFADGHYRLEWAANGSNAKQKTFWIACDETPPSQDETPPSQDETPPSQDETPPSQDETPPSQDENGGDPDPGQQPEQEVESGTSHDGNGSVDGSQSGGGPASDLPDTAAADSVPSTGLGGALAATGILLIVIAHAGTRRERLLPTA